MTNTLTPREREIESLIDICETNGYTYDLLDGSMDVKTSTDYWKIIFKSKMKSEEQWVVLKHLNQRGKMTFHKQGKNDGKYLFPDAVKQIIGHEKYVLKRKGVLQ